MRLINSLIYRTVVQQLFVRADSDECAVVQNENFICLPDSGDALRYKKCGYNYFR